MIFMDLFRTAFRHPKPAFCCRVTNSDYKHFHQKSVKIFKNWNLKTIIIKVTTKLAASTNRGNTLVDTWSSFKASYEVRKSRSLFVNKCTYSITFGRYLRPSSGKYHKKDEKKSHEIYALSDFTKELLMKNSTQKIH